ncbi:energy-coupling factor transporter transmembrane component T family protein [Halovivax limisalsi]|uniref:energy-coupling factor transporter transmembrane component T family protein n=1 Tax=Halovivax limisalsi TaxID=1453760 RepID=UPI001FFD267D|nr:energy-coupling factor transporter transmembrane component T [Halovivax limisalsi]
MLAYEPDETLAHTLDPRSKLAFQVAFAVAALAHSSPSATAALSLLALIVVMGAGVALGRTLYAYRYVFGFLSISVILSAVTRGPPWIDVADAIATASASYRVVLILLVSAAYVRSTPVRDSEAAFHRLVPGRVGRLLGLGVSLVFRFLPVLQADIRTIRNAMATRLGTERSAHDRAARIGALGLSRAFRRADRLSVALQARCLSWNPTLPPLSFGRRDLPVFAIALGLVISSVL